MIDARPRADWQNGLISNDIFVDEEIFRQELDRVFKRCWLFLGHESSIPNNGDYLTNYMGLDQVILLRDLNGTLRVFLNKCLHRGNKVCLFDRGNAKTFTCTFHGWQYDTAGQIIGLPYFEDAYRGELDREHWGLVEVPRVASYGGFVFACWDSGVMPLDDYLGDLRWYVDRFLVREHLGGVEVVGGVQRYAMPSNWKLLCDNFAGDDYHVPTTHASYFKVLMEDSRSHRIGFDMDKTITVSLGHTHGVPHGIGAIGVGDGSEQREIDLKLASQYGPEVIEWVTERWARVTERMKNDSVTLWKITNANVFPHFCILANPSAFQGQALILWEPRQAVMTECWQWCAVDRDAPKVIKQLQVSNLMKGQAAAGMIATDDSENFERSTDNLLGHVSTEQPFHYAMALGRDCDPEWHRKLDAMGIDVTELPGLAGPHVWEAQQRQFYRYWSQLMATEG